MRKTLHIFSLLCLVAVCSAQTNYYISKTGRSAGLGTIGDPVWGPNYFTFSVLASGDSLLFEYGYRWDSVEIEIDTEVNVYIGCYGDPDDGRVILSGGTSMGTWTDNLDGTWTATNTEFPTSYLRYMVEDEGSSGIWYANNFSYLLIGGTNDIFQHYDIAEEPDGALNYLEIDGYATNGRDYLIDNELPFANGELNSTNAACKINTRAYLADDVRVSYNTSDRIYFTTSDFQNVGKYMNKTGITYKVINYGMDNEGEWIRDRSTGEVTVQWAGDPNDSTVYMFPYNATFTLTSCNNVTVEGLEIWGGLESTFKDVGGWGNIHRNLKIKYGGTYAYWLDNTSATLINDTIQDCTDNGIVGTDCDTVEIYGGLVQDLGSNVGGDRDLSYTGVSLKRRDGPVTVRRLHTNRTGLSGISVHDNRAYTDGAFIDSNLVQYSGLMLNDVGGIYPSHDSVTNNSSTITYNIVDNQFENTFVRNGTSEQSAAVYFDVGAAGYTVENNFINRTQLGVKSNGCSDNIVKYNTLVNVGAYALMAVSSGYGHYGDPTADSDFKYDTVIVSYESGAQAVRWLWNGSSFNSNGTEMDSNFYNNPFDITNDGLCIDSYEAWTHYDKTLPEWRVISSLEDVTEYNGLFDNWISSNVTVHDSLFVKPLWNFSNETRNVYLYDVIYKDAAGVNHSGIWSIPPYQGRVGYFVSGTPSNAALIPEGFITGDVEPTPNYMLGPGNTLIYKNGKYYAFPKQ